MKKNNVVFSSTRIKSEQDFSIRILFELEKSRRIQALINILQVGLRRHIVLYTILSMLENWIYAQNLIITNKYVPQYQEQPNDPNIQSDILQV